MSLFRKLCHKTLKVSLTRSGPGFVKSFNTQHTGFKTTVCHVRSFTVKNNVSINQNCVNTGINKQLKTTILLHRFHTSPRRNVNPLFWVIIKPVGKLSAILTGRGIRKWWQSLPDKKRGLFIHWVKRSWHLIAVGSLILITGGFSYYESHLKEAPITGRKRFIAFNHEQLMKIVENEVENEIETNKSRILPATHPYYNYIIGVAERLFLANRDIPEMQQQKWRLIVIESEAFNAHVYPTGDIVVNTQVMKVIQNKDQLAVILGHEMSHALLEHAAEQVSYAQMVDFFVITFMTAIWAIMPNDGIAIVTQWFMNRVIHIMKMLPYSRMMEKEADRVGLMLAAKACFDVREGSVVWAKMSLVDTFETDKMPEWLSTHPANETRIELIEALLPKMYEKMVECKCPPLPERDPRKVIKLFQNVEVAVKARQNLNRLKPTNRKSA